MDTNTQNQREKLKKGKMGARASLVAALTFLSRIFGLVRDTLIAHILGAKEAADAFYVAFRIPNLFRRLLAEGNLTLSFVPVFTESLKESESKARELSNIIFSFLTVFLILLTLLGVFGAGFLVKTFAFGFSEDPQKFLLTKELTQITFPYLAMVSLSALCMGILNARFRFAAPAASPVMLNLGIIGSAFFLKDVFENPSYALAWGVLIGGILQLALQIPHLIKEGFGFRFHFKLHHPGVSKVAKLMLPAILGSAAYQINLFAITQMASFLPTGTVSYLWYSDRIIEFPLGVFAISVATVALPSFSVHAANQDQKALARSFGEALNLVWFLNVPACVGLFFLAEPIVNMLFQHGDFGLEASRQTALTVKCFALGLPFVSASRMMSSIYFSMQDSKTPVNCGIAAVFINITMGVILMQHYQHLGLALGVVSGSVLNFLLLLLYLRKKMGQMGLRRIFINLGKTLFSTLLMGILLFWIMAYYHDAGHFSSRVLQVIWMISAGTGFYLLSSFVFKSEQLKPLMKKFKKR